MLYWTHWYTRHCTHAQNILNYNTNYTHTQVHKACTHSDMYIIGYSQVSALPFSLINEIKGSMSYKLVEMPLVISLKRETFTISASFPMYNHVYTSCIPYFL